MKENKENVFVKYWCSNQCLVYTNEEILQSMSWLSS